MKYWKIAISCSKRDISSKFLFVTYHSQISFCEHVPDQGFLVAPLPGESRSIRLSFGLGGVKPHVGSFEGVGARAALGRFFDWKTLR